MPVKRLPTWGITDRMQDKAFSSLHAGSRSRTWQGFSDILFAKSISVPLLEPRQVFLQGTNQLKNIGELLPERQVKFKQLNKLFNGPMAKPWILVAHCQKKLRISGFQKKMLVLGNFPVTQLDYRTVNLRLGCWLETKCSVNVMIINEKKERRVKF